jgi:hypothetical protein
MGSSIRTIARAEHAQASGKQQNWANLTTNDGIRYALASLWGDCVITIAR